MLLARFELNYESKYKRAAKFARFVKRRFFEQNLTTMVCAYSTRELFQNVKKLTAD